MKRTSRLAAVPAALIALLLMAPGALAGPGPKDVQCQPPAATVGAYGYNVFSGTAKDLTVPANTTCVLDGATITHDVNVQKDASLAAEDDASGNHTTIGHDLNADRPVAIATGWGFGHPGPVSIGHDMTLSGADGQNGFEYAICNTTIGHDLNVTNTFVAYNISIGDIGDPDYHNADFEECTYQDPAHPTDAIGHDANISNNTAGQIDVGNDTFGHDLNVLGNMGTTLFGYPGTLDVSDNVVANNATCLHNDPNPAPDGSEDQPNQAKRNTGC